MNRLALPDISRKDILATLEAVRPGPLRVLYDAGREAGLCAEDATARTVAIYFNFCAGHLSDDLSDEECTYLDTPTRVGPCTQLILQSLFFLGIAEAGLPAETISSVAMDLIAAVGQQHVALRTAMWNARIFREVAEGIAARQWFAYLKALWFATPWADSAAILGRSVAIAAHVAKDILSDDPRYTTLSRADQAEVAFWALKQRETARSYGLRCFDNVLDRAATILETVVHPGSGPQAWGGNDII